MRSAARSIALAACLAAGAPGVALAGCGESIGLLEAQIGLIASAGPLAGDRNTPLGPGRDTLITLEKPELTARTRAAFDVLGGGPSAAGDKEFARALEAARSALGEARAAFRNGDEAGCEEAIALGLQSAREARAAFN